MKGLNPFWDCKNLNAESSSNGNTVVREHNQASPLCFGENPIPICRTSFTSHILIVLSSLKKRANNRQAIQQGISPDPCDLPASGFGP